jgi:hypothetical protein
MERALCLPQKLPLSALVRRFSSKIFSVTFFSARLKSAHIALMDIDATRLEESHIVVRKLMDSVGATAKSAAIASRNCAAGCGFCGGRFSDWRL